MMRVVVTAVVLLFGAFATAGDKKADPLSKDAKKELERLQGEWTLTEVQRAGEEVRSQRLQAGPGNQGNKVDPNGTE